MNTKTCCRCRVEKEEIEFSRRGTGLLRPDCKACRVLQEQDRKRRSPEIYEAKKAQMRLEWSTNPTKKLHRMAIRLASLYEITYDVAMKFLAYGRWLPCAICENKPTEGLVIDHCHTKRFVRGYVCSDCNKALGFVKDNPETARKLAVYLENFRS